MSSFIYFAPLLLYFPRFIPNVETQSLLITGVALFGLLFGQKQNAARSFLWLVIAVMFWILSKTLIDGGFSNSLGLFQILIGPLVLFGALGLQAPPPSRKAMAGVAIYFLFCAVLEILLPEIYRLLASTLLSRVSVTDGHRGVSLLTPEPTYAAISLIYFVMLAWWSGKHWGFRYRWIEPALVFCLLATGSTYVALLLLAIAYVQWPRVMVLGTVAAIIGIRLITVDALGNDESIRAVVAVSRLLATDFNDFLPAISLVDSSLGSRLATNSASFLTLSHSPLGLGLSCAAVPNAFEAAGFHFALTNAVLVEVIEDGCVKPQSYLASVALGLGIVSLAFLSLLIALVIRSARPLPRSIWMAPLAVAVVMLVIQGQITNPIPWLLIFFALKGHPNFHAYRRFNHPTYLKVALPK